MENFNEQFEAVDPGDKPKTPFQLGQQLRIDNPGVVIDPKARAELLFASKIDQGEFEMGYYYKHNSTVNSSNDRRYG